MFETHCLIIIFKNFSRLFVVADLLDALPLQVPLFELLQKAAVSSPPSSKHHACVVFPYKHCSKPQNLFPPFPKSAAQLSVKPRPHIMN